MNTSKYSPKKFIVWPTKRYKCLGRYVMLRYVSIKNKVDLTFYNPVKSWGKKSVKHRFNKNCGQGIDIQSRNICSISCYVYKQKKHL